MIFRIRFFLWLFYFYSNFFHFFLFHVHSFPSRSTIKKTYDSYSKTFIILLFYTDCVFLHMEPNQSYFQIYIHSFSICIYEYTFEYIFETDLCVSTDHHQSHLLLGFQMAQFLCLYSLISFFSTSLSCRIFFSMGHIRSKCAFSPKIISIFSIIILAVTSGILLSYSPICHSHHDLMVTEIFICCSSWLWSVKVFT